MLYSLHKVKAVIAYNGHAYKGFQKQKSTPNTITHDLEKALSSLGINDNITGSGRTDAGVHATGQVIHFSLPLFWKDLNRLKDTLNQKLHSIQVKHISWVKDDFHARFSAKKRLYRYVFKTQKPSIFEQESIAYYPVFNPSLLEESLSLFIGKHDFNFFRKTGTQTYTSIRTVFYVRYIQRGNYHFIYFQADGFLRAQVRMMIQSAMAYTQNQLTLKQIKEQLSCQRKHHTKLAPPQGLYLAKIIY